MATKRRLRAGERRAVILEAALRLFSERGFEATSMATVARAAGVTKPVLYEHFDSKEGLYASLLERESKTMRDATLSALDPDAPLEQRLREVAAAAISFARGNPRSSRLLAQAPLGVPSIAAAHERVRARRREATAAAILADPAFTPLPGLSRPASGELLGDLHNAVLERLVRWAVEHPRAPAEALAGVYADVLWTGLSGGPALSG